MNENQKELDLKQKLILDIQKLLNSYDATHTTTINPSLLQYMDEKDLKQIIDDLLTQKEQLLDQNKEWLSQFKKDYK